MWGRKSTNRKEELKTCERLVLSNHMTVLSESAWNCTEIRHGSQQGREHSHGTMHHIANEIIFQ